MKTLFALIFSSLIASTAISQTFEWKRLSYSIADSAYDNATYCSAINSYNSNYYFSYFINSHVIDWTLPAVYYSGYIHPTILTNNNTLIMADTITYDSIKIPFDRPNSIISSFIQGNIFRVLINYTYLDSAFYHGNHFFYRQGSPIPKVNGFLLLNYSLAGSFLGYDTLQLPNNIQPYAQTNELFDSKTINIGDVLVNSNDELFLYVRLWGRDSYIIGSSQPLDTMGFIIKYNADLSPSQKTIPIVMNTDNSGDKDRIKLQLFNDNMFLLGEIKDSVYIDNMLFTSNETGNNTFAVRFNSTLSTTLAQSLPGSFVDFSMTDNGSVVLLSTFNAPIVFGSDTVIPSLYYDSFYDSTMYMQSVLISKLSNSLFPLNCIYIDTAISQKSLLHTNNNRVFVTNLIKGGTIHNMAGDSLINPVPYVSSTDNIILLNENTLIPLWHHEWKYFSVSDLYFDDNKLLLIGSPYPYVCADFGDDTTTIPYMHLPNTLAMLDIYGLGLDEALSTEEPCPLLIYPNPSSNIVWLKLPENESFSVFLYDMSGRNIMHAMLNSDNNQIDISSLKPGFYCIQAQNSSRNLIGKLLKE